MDRKKIISTYKLFCQHKVGHLLAKTAQGVPYVDAAYTNSPERPYPHMTISLNDLEITGEQANNILMEEDTERHYFYRRFLLSITCYGGNAISDDGKNATSILDSLAQTLHLTASRCFIEENSETNIQHVGVVLPTPQMAPDRFIDTATLEIEGVGWSVIEDPDPLTFDSFSIDLKTYHEKPNSEGKHLKPPIYSKTITS